MTRNDIRQMVGPSVIPIVNFLFSKRMSEQFLFILSFLPHHIFMSKFYRSYMGKEYPQDTGYDLIEFMHNKLHCIYDTPDKDLYDVDHINKTAVFYVVINNKNPVLYQIIPGFIIDPFMRECYVSEIRAQLFLALKDSNLDVYVLYSENILDFNEMRGLCEKMSDDMLTWFNDNTTHNQREWVFDLQHLTYNISKT